jgi:hypothetical protein
LLEDTKGGYKVFVATKNLFYEFKLYDKELIRSRLSQAFLTRRNNFTFHSFSRASLWSRSIDFSFKAQKDAGQVIWNLEFIARALGT